MRIPEDRRPSKGSKKQAPASTSPDLDGAEPIVASPNDRAAVTANVQASEFWKHNTAGGRKPIYMPEYADRAKGMCERGATLDELADVFDVSPDVIRRWQISHTDFYEATKLTPACSERVKRSLFESSIGQKVVTTKIVETGSQRQTTYVTHDLPANVRASKFFVSDEVVQTEGELTQLLKQLQDARTRPAYRGPNRKMISHAEHVALGGVPGGEIDWSVKSDNEINAAERKLQDMRQKS